MLFANTDAAIHQDHATAEQHDNEDDPQNGYDHIDGHRSLCLMISAYSRPGVNHGFYNQTSVLRTILHVLSEDIRRADVLFTNLKRLTKPIDKDTDYN